MDRSESGKARVGDVLEHYGIKGMQWGVRKAKSSNESKGSTPEGFKTGRSLVLTKNLKNGGKLNVIEKGYDERSVIDKFFIEKSSSYREAAKGAHSFVLTNKDGAEVGRAAFHENPASKTIYLADLKVSKDHRRQGYAKATLEAAVTYGKEKNYTSLEMLATPMGAPLYQSLGFKSKDGKVLNTEKNVRTNLMSQYSFYSMELPQNDKVKHAETPPGVNRLAELIVEYVDADPELNEPTADDVLAHYGIKGMKWGVRRKDPSSKGQATDVEVKTSPGRKVSTSGGKNQPASEDAKRIAVSRQKAKSSSTDSLSNKELKDLVERMNMEQQYSKLTSSNRSTNPGVKFAQDMLTNVAKQQASRIANDYASKLVSEAMKKR